VGFTGWSAEESGVSGRSVRRRARRQGKRLFVWAVAILVTAVTGWLVLSGPPG
jgi:hypothetical protein